MKRKMFAIVMAVMLCVSCLSLTAFAAEEEAQEMVPVVVQVPENWESPCLWAWADDGTNAFEAWPGEELVKLDSGWYYTYVPAFVQNMIVNANFGTDAAVQCSDIAVEAGKAVWITVAEDLSATVSYEALTQDEIPAYVEMFVVHASVPESWETVNMWAWLHADGTGVFDAWPGGAMTAGENGWYTCKAPAWVDRLIINGNAGSVQTADIEIEGKELWVTVNEDLSYELSYEDPATAAENITVYAKVPEDWADPGCWAWLHPDGTNAFSAWPGEMLTKDGDWYTISVPGWINSIIINGNGGSVQTSDLTVEPGKDLWIVVNNPLDAVVTYEEPADVPAVEETEAPTTEPAATEPSTTEPAPVEEGGSATGWIIGGIAVVALGGGAAVAISKKKKK